jgi:hypothetical protein
MENPGRIKQFIKKIIPQKERKKISKTIRLFKYRYFSLSATFVRIRIHRKVTKRKKLNVLFLEARKQTWFFDDIYKLFSLNQAFSISVLVIPFGHDNSEEILKNMEEVYSFLQNRGIKCIRSFDDERCTFKKIKTFKPDILFFSYAWEGHLHKNYFARNYRNSLNYYIGYYISVPNNLGNYNLLAHNIATKYFCETTVHLEIAKKTADNRGRNIVVSGHPKLDKYFDCSYSPADVWKKQTTNKKRIIWAPHWSFGDSRNSPVFVSASFYEIAGFMVEIVEKYQEKIQFAFKPHPLMRGELKKHWTKEKINEYYALWDEMPNTQFEDGAYIDLFLTSDAMIFDSMSFMVEYMLTRNPALYTVCSHAYLNLNEFGINVYKELYHTNNIKADIDQFIANVVLNGNDYKKKSRLDFISEYLVPPNNKSASENIYHTVLEDIGLK